MFKIVKSYLHEPSMSLSYLTNELSQVTIALFDPLLFSTLESNTVIQLFPDPGGRMFTLTAL